VDGFFFFFFFGEHTKHLWWSGFRDSCNATVEKKQKLSFFQSAFDARSNPPTPPSMARRGHKLATL
jgi:hypothetical protein